MVNTGAQLRVGGFEGTEGYRRDVRERQPSERRVGLFIEAQHPQMERVAVSKQRPIQRESALEKCRIGAVRMFILSEAPRSAALIGWNRRTTPPCGNPESSPPWSTDIAKKRT